MVIGDQSSVGDDGIVWSCQGGGIVKIAPYNDQWAGIGPGSPDLITHIDWYREFRPAHQTGWLTTEKANDAIALSNDFAISAIDGGYVIKKEDKAFRFPLRLIDLKTGTDRTATVVVPLNSAVPEPKQNYSGGADQFHTFGPYLLGITEIQMQPDHRVQITFGMDHSVSRVRFDLAQITGPFQTREK